MMLSNEKEGEDSNFWISYADLMAGLLFVFILLIGAIISKSIILKSDLHKKESKLEQLSTSLKSKETKLNDISDSLAKSEAINSEKDDLLTFSNSRIEKSEKKLTQSETKLQLLNARVAKDQLKLSENERIFKVNLDEIRKLNRLLLESNTQQDKLSSKIIVVQNLLDDEKNSTKQTKDELEKKRKSLADYEGKVMILSNKLAQTEDNVKLKDEKLLALLNSIDEKKTKYDSLLANLQSQKAKIRSLSGMKLKVLSSLKEALGDKINIDKKNGSLRLSSNILFSSGGADLKAASKVKLKKAFEEYIGALVTNKNIRPHIDQIIIVGHTDSEGSYMYNLDLSQKRALQVMRYFLTLDFTKKHNIQNILTAQGRGYLDAVKVNGVEDKEASRRIEIKFTLKNQDAMNEISKVLDAE
jgi:chemotaxis protein MotB